MKNEKINIRLIWLLSLLAVLTACTKGFENINKNPNQAESTNEIYYMTNAIVSLAYAYQDEAYMDEPASAGRYITKVKNAETDNFGWNAISWDADYLRLTTVKTLHDMAEEAGDEQYVAVAEILSVFNFAYITDRWGDIPYSNALLSKDKQIVYPQYDQQKDIYPDLLKRLKAANDVLKSTMKAIDNSADALYHGDIMKWRKFANSLRLRLLLRCSKSYADATAQIKEIASNPADYPVFTSNDDNAEVPYVGSFKWSGGPTEGGDISNPVAEFPKRKPSKEMVDFLIQRNDPRLPVLVAKVKADPATATVDHNDYVGVPNSINAPYEYNGGDDHISMLNPDLFYQDQNPMVRASLMTYPEVCFILAEAVQQKNVTVPGKTAESLYDDGIEAAMDYWGVAGEADATHYYDNPLVKYDGTLKQLIGQKWMALFLKGPEGWFEYRRTDDVLGFNALLGPRAAQRNIPYRYIYPDGERNLNRAEYDKAVSVFGPDTRNTLMWYLK